MSRRNNARNIKNARINEYYDGLLKKIETAGSIDEVNQILDKKPSLILEVVKNKASLEHFLDLLGPIKGESRAEFIDRVERLEEKISGLSGKKQILSILKDFKESKLKTEFKITAETPDSQLRARYEAKLEKIQKEYKTLLNKLQNQSKGLEVKTEARFFKAVAKELQLLEEDAIKLGKGGQLPSFIRREDLISLVSKRHAFLTKFAKDAPWFSRLVGTDTKEALKESPEQFKQRITCYWDSISNFPERPTYAADFKRLENGTTAPYSKYIQDRNQLQSRLNALIKYADRATDDKNYKGVNEDPHQLYTHVPFHQLSNTLRREQGVLLDEILRNLNSIAKREQNVKIGEEQLTSYEERLKFLKSILESQQLEKGSELQEQYAPLFAKNFNPFGVSEERCKADAYIINELTALYHEMSKAETSRKIYLGAEDGVIAAKNEKAQQQAKVKEAPSKTKATIDSEDEKVVTQEEEIDSFEGSLSPSDDEGSSVKTPGGSSHGSYKEQPRFFRTQSSPSLQSLIDEEERPSPEL
ncbi:hypothetical protein [Legionella brunensis]|uniref:Uncharacterized protein n=1 Tax=Legionella brunensis TaxID=29422 RepID=A0A0W0SDK5_9GAMM|nr:hypothetical protein [Legionella brunensis]KTC81463.1 hypothetical protein Lbru_1983 [Legionella brunensis]